MGIYACANCFDEYDLTDDHWTCVGCCEICGPLKRDWERKHTTWTFDIDRQIPEDKAYLRRRLAELVCCKAAKLEAPEPSEPE